MQIERSIIQQVLGTLMANPVLLNDTDKFNLEISDFPNQIDRFIFSAIYNLYIGGAELIHTIDIDNYLKENPLARELIEKENGIQFLQDCEQIAEPQNFQYYYSKLKKLNLIKDLQKKGYDTSKIYCEDSLEDDFIKINEKFEKMTTTDIINYFKLDISSVEKQYCFNQTIEECYATDGIYELMAKLKESPEIGVKLQGEIYNMIVRGGRKKTVYLRSSESGGGKSRQAVGDACEIAYPIRYEPQYGKWVSTGPCEKVLYIMTEQDVNEIQTMVLAYLTGYNEEIFKYGQFNTPERMERVNKALKIMEEYKDNLLFARVPDPCASVVKNLFRRYSLQYGVSNFFFDYIFSSPAMLEEYRDLKLPEHVCLRLFTTTLKNLAIELDAFVSTSTQISESEVDKKSSWKDYHNIAGARAICFLVDVGCITSRPTQEELKQLSSFIEQYGITPNMVTDFYKNRGGRWTMIRVWSVYDYGTLRRKDLFVTTPNLKPISDFQLVSFFTEKTEEEIELEKRFNEDCEDTEINEIIENLAQPFEVPFDEDVAAFGDLNEQRKRVKSKGFEEFL